MMSVKKPNGSYHDARNPPLPGWEFKQERLHSVSEIRSKLQTLTAQMNLWGFHYTEIFCVRFAIGEALHNAIEHGHQGDESKTVQFNYLISADYVLAEIIDEGPGFDPKSVPNPFAAKAQAKPARRGLFFMSLFMSWVRFEGKGNRVTMCKMRSPSIGGFGRSDN